MKLWFPARKTKCPHCDKELKLDITIRVNPVVVVGRNGLEAFDGAR